MTGFSLICYMHLAGDSHLRVALVFYESEFMNSFTLVIFNPPSPHSITTASFVVTAHKRYCSYVSDGGSIVATSSTLTISPKRKLCATFMRAFVKQDISIFRSISLASRDPEGRLGNSVFCCKCVSVDGSYGNVELSEGGGLGVCPHER